MCRVPFDLERGGGNHKQVQKRDSYIHISKFRLSAYVFLFAVKGSHNVDGKITDSETVLKMSEIQLKANTKRFSNHVVLYTALQIHPKCETKRLPSSKGCSALTANEERESNGWNPCREVWL